MVRRRTVLGVGLGAFVGLGSRSLAAGSKEEQADRRGGQPSRAGNRLVQVATISQDGISRGADASQVAETLRRMDQAASGRPDIVCLPEHFSGGAAEPVPGPCVEKLAEWAREHRCYVICPLHVIEQGRTYNSAVLLDRQGRVQGRYDKAHPVGVEIDRGITPGGSEPPVFRTDFGLIGIQICFDVNWTASWTHLQQQGAEIVFFCSAYPAARQLAMLARMHEYYIVCAARDRSSTIWDIVGDPIDSSGKFRQWAQAMLCLDKRLFEIDEHTSKAHAIEQKYGRSVDVRWYHDEDWFTLSSLDSEINVPQIIAEFGLTPLRDYVRTQTTLQDNARP